jgi:hypothetical protein
MLYWEHRGWKVHIDCKCPLAIFIYA